MSVNEQSGASEKLISMGMER